MDELLKKRNRFILYQNFLGKIIEESIDCEEVFKIIISQPDFFIWTEYALYTEEFFEEILIRKITYIKDVISQGEKLKLLLRYAEDMIKDEMLKVKIPVILEREKQNNTIVWNKFIVRKFELCSDIDKLIDLYIDFAEYFDDLDVMGSFLFVFHDICNRNGFSSERFLKKYSEKISINIKDPDFFEICGDFLKEKRQDHYFCSFQRRNNKVI